MKRTGNRARGSDIRRKAMSAQADVRSGEAGSRDLLFAGETSREVARRARKVTRVKMSK